MTEAGADRGDLSGREGESRRLTSMFCDVVGSTELSARQDPETYRELMRRYRAVSREIIESQFEGHILHMKGDGILSTFGYPVAHENDAERAVRAGLALVEAVHDIPRDIRLTIGESLEIRVAVHSGGVLIEIADDDIMGFAANLVARLQTVADPGTVLVSDEIRELVEDRFELEAREAQEVKGVNKPLVTFRVVRERRVPGRRSRSTPLLERETELEQLRQAWARVEDGIEDRATGALVRGDAGVGKSRLVTAFAEQLGAANAEVVWLHGSPFHLDAGFHPVRCLVETRCGIREDTTGAERLDCLTRELSDLGFDLAETIPLLAPVLRIEPSAGYDQATTQGRKLETQVTDAVLRYIEACTQPRPAAIVAENLHWFDKATRALLGRLLRAEPGTLLVVGTSREQEDGRWETIELGSLTLAGRLTLIDALDDNLGEEERLAHAMRSDGIPLYLEELVRAGAMHHRSQAGVDAPVPGSVPAALYEPLVARLYAAPAALPVAAAAAAAGVAVDRSLLAATIKNSREALDASLRTLVDAQILEAVGGRSARYQFRHELLREVAYELQPPWWLREVHSRLGELLRGDEDHEPSDWHVVASHFERAERPVDAAAAYQRTAEWAYQRGALDEALDDLGRAIELVTPLAGDPARDHREVQLRLRRGFIIISAEDAANDEAFTEYDRCLELAAADPHGDDMFSTLISLWAHYLSHADLERARQLSLTLRAALDGEREIFRPQNLAGFGILDWFAGNFDGALDALTRATGELAQVGGEHVVAAAWFVPNDPTVAMHVHLALARFMAADLAGAADSLVRARAVADSLTFPQGPWSAAYTAWLGSWVWIEAGRFDLADEAVADLRASSDRHGLHGWQVIAEMQATVLEAVTALKSGTADAVELDDLAERVDINIMLWETGGLRLFLPFYLTTAGALLAAAGDSDGARQRYEASLALAAETGMRFYDAETTRRLALLDFGAEVATLRDASELAQAQGARPFELRVALDLHAVLGEVARPDLERAMGPFDAAATTVELAEARARMVAAR